MKKLWLMLADRFDALQPRERVAVFASIVAVLIGAFWVLAFDPALMRRETAAKSLEQSAKLRTALEAQELAQATAAGASPDDAVRKRIAELKKQNDGLRGGMSTLSTPFVSPQRMRAMLQDMVASQKGVGLASMRSLPVEDLLALDPSAPVAASAGGGLFRHGLEVVVQGEYGALTAYLDKVERLPWHAQIASVSLQAETWPVASMKIVLYTLSMERAWIGL